MPSAPALLRPTQAADLDFVLAAEQAPENAQFIGSWTRDRHWQACHDPNERHWLVVNAATEEPAGYVIMVDVQNPDECILIKRVVITQKGLGLGRSALEQVITTAFLDYQAHRVWLDVMADNGRARSLYRALGFVEEGGLRESTKTSRGY
ncbi:MAG TPA: GNAT family N-acetyltransferase, partial [Candidatus Obscuribacterales bacterium]